MGLARHARHRLHDLHLDVIVPADALLGGVEGLALLVAQVMPHWMVGQLRRRLRRRGAVLCRRSRGARRGTRPRAPAAGTGPDRPGRRRGGGRPAGREEAARRVDAGARRRRDQPVGVAGEVARRHDGDGRRRVHAGGGRHVGHPPRPPARAAVPGRALRLAAAGHLGRVRGLARRRCAGRRPDPEARRRDGEPPGRRIAGFGGHRVPPPPSARRTSCGTGSSPRTTPAWPGAGEPGLRERRRGDPARVVNPLVEDVSRWPTGARMERFLAEALPLGKDAVAPPWPRPGSRQRRGPARGRVLHRLRDPGPGHPARPRPGHAAGRSAAVRGSHGLLRGAARRSARRRLRRARGRPAVLLCLELTSLHVQPRRRPTWSRWSRTRCSPTRPPPSSSCPAATGAAGSSTSSRRHRRHHRRPHDLGRHRPRLPDGAVAPGARGPRPHVGAAGRGAARRARAARRRRRRLGRAPGRPAHPRRGARRSSASPRRTWRRRARCWPSTATARRPPCCSCSTSSERTSRTLAGEHVVALAFGPGLTLYAVLLRRQ